MTHNEIRRALAVYRDLRGAERDEVDRHLQSSAGCSAQLKAYRADDDQLRYLRDERPDTRLRERMLEATYGALTPSRESRHVPALRLAIGALSVLLVVSVAFLSFGGNLPLTGFPALGLRTADTPSPASSAVGGFVWQTDGTYGYRMMRPKGEEWAAESAPGWRFYLMPRSLQGRDALGLRVTNLSAVEEGRTSDDLEVLALFEANPSLDGWTAGIEAGLARDAWQPIRLVRSSPAAKIYLLPADASLDPRAIRLTGFRVEGDAALMIDLFAIGSYASLDRLEADGIVEDLATMLNSASAIPVDPTNISPALPPPLPTPPMPVVRPTSTPAPRPTSPVIGAAPTGLPPAPGGTPAAVIPAPAATTAPEGMRRGNVTTVELDIFSGRPNPSWSLSETEAQQLRAKLEKLPEVACRPLDLPLGYRGFVVQLAQRPELSNEYRVRVYNGQARWGDPWSPGTVAFCVADSGREVERFLLAGARPHVSGDIYSMVESQIGATGAPSPTATTAAPTAASSPAATAAGTLAYIRDGATWAVTLPNGKPRRLAPADPDVALRWSSSGRWLATRYRSG